MILRKLLESLTGFKNLNTLIKERKIINEFISLMKKFQNNSEIEHLNINDAFLDTVLRKMI